MTDTISNRATMAGLIVGISATFALGAYVGHGTADTDSAARHGTTDYVSGDATVPGPLPDGDPLTRDPAPIVGDVTAPWERADTAGTNGDTTLPPCEREDSHACHWDADTRGNGTGRSFISHGDGSTTYLDTLTPCEREERPTRNDPCHWDASERGNGTGTSFVSSPDGSVIRLAD